MAAKIGQLGFEYHPWRWTLTFDYDPAMVEALKANIPSRSRKWNPDLRQWWFKSDQIDSVERLARMYCGRVEYEQGRRSHQWGASPHTGTSTLADAYQTLYVTPGAPPEVIRAAYRALSKLYHPDVGGDTAMMQKVNEAYGRLQQSMD